MCSRNERYYLVGREKRCYLIGGYYRCDFAIRKEACYLHSRNGRYALDGDNDVTYKVELGYVTQVSYSIEKK